jgi:hypothetical protein
VAVCPARDLIETRSVAVQVLILLGAAAVGSHASCPARASDRPPASVLAPACPPPRLRPVLRLTGGGADAGEEPFLLCTDLDDTLVGDAAALEEFNRMWRSDLSPRGCKLVYNTGRSLKDYKALRADWDLIIPDAFIGGCGTQVYTFDDQGNEQPVNAWVASLKSSFDKAPLASRILSSARLQERYNALSRVRTHAHAFSLALSVRVWVCM